jgi:hypothetical protein
VDQLGDGAEVRRYALVVQLAPGLAHSAALGVGSWRRAGARCDPQTVDGQDTVDPFDSEHLVVGADERYEYVGG